MTAPIEIETAPNPTTAIIVLHGLGADGNDFVPICNELNLSAIGGVRFVFPHAAERPVTVNGGYRMRAWYDIKGADLQQGEDAAGMRESIAVIEGLLADQRARGIAPERTVLMGFSQGCAMTLLAGLRHAERLAGLVGLSGYLPMAEATAAERSAANQGLPIFLAHGLQDPIVAMARARAARAALESFGHPVEWHEYPMPHSVCMEEIAALNQWLLMRLK